MNSPCSLRRVALVAVLIAPQLASGQWSANPALNTPISVTPGDQAVPKIAAVGDGRTWFGWFDNRNGAYEVYVQLLDAAGLPQFAPNGLLVSNQPQLSSLVDWDLECASNGDAVLVFTDARNGTDLDVYAYRITPAGGFAWGAAGVTLSSNSDYEPSPRCAVLDDGASVFVWAQIPNSGTGSIRVQVLDAAGVPRFPLGGLGIPGVTNEKPAFSDVVPAPGGGFVVSWVRNIAQFTSPRHLRAQKFDAAGTALWNSGAPLSVFDATSLSIAYWPEIQPDGSGGAAFAWHRASGSFFECFVQKISAAGAELFPHNGLQVSLESNVMKLDPSLAVLDASGDLVLCYNRRNTAQSQWGVGAQRIDAAGTRLWGNDGVLLEPLDSKNESFERIVPFGDGALVAWFDNPNTPLPDARVVAQRLDGAGNALWSPGGVVLSTQAPAQAAKDDLELALDASGTLRATWDDNRTDPGGDVYAQNVHFDGALGPVTTCTASTYCVGAANSVGAGARIGFSGSTSVALNNLILRASGTPPVTNGIFFYGPTASAPLPFKNGFMCISGGTIRLPLVTTDALGQATRTVDLNAPPVPAGQITAGSSWSFQFWYRDSAAPPFFTNTSDALRAAFCP